MLMGVALRVDGQIDRVTGKNFATRSEVLATHGIVCTSVPAATQVGLEILKHGGSAVDAAIAANATLGLMEPVSSGIGGGSFAPLFTPERKQALRNHRERPFPAWSELRSDESRTGEAASRHDSADRHAADQRSRLHRRMGGAAQKIWQTEIERRSRPGGSLCRGRFSGHRI